MHTVVHCNCFVLQLAICYILPYSHLSLTLHRQELSKHSVKGGAGCETAGLLCSGAAMEGSGFDYSTRGGTMTSEAAPV